MHIRWRGLELPSVVRCDPESLTATHGLFFAEPFERGYGSTVGNSLRRILLSSVEGAAVTTIKIAGVQHEFSTIPGVREDVTDIVLNIKGLALNLYGDPPRMMTVQRATRGEIRAADIEADSNIEIITLKTLPPNGNKAFNGSGMKPNKRVVMTEPPTNVTRMMISAAKRNPAPGPAKVINMC
jgi:hypothetical protein